MKFDTVVHHFFDAIRKYRIMYDRWAVGAEDAMDMLAAILPERTRHPIYVLREPANETLADETLVRMATEEVKRGGLRLPFPRTVWQFTVTDMVDDPARPDACTPDVWIVLASEIQEEGGAPDIWISLFTGSAADPREWLVIPAAARIHDGQLRLMRFQMKDPPPNDADRAARDTAMIQDAAMFVCTCLVLMQSPAVEVEAVKVPRDVNRGRRLMKRPQVPDHGVIRLPRLAYVGKDTPAGTHARPRCHWRRSHRREFKPGEWTDIPLTLVARRGDEPPPPPPVTEIVTRG
jgi:hypothetical protein